MFRYLIPLIVCAGLVAFLAAGLGRNPTDVPSPLVGRNAPAFVLPTLSDATKTVSLAAFKGRAVVLNVWGSWCPACRDEHVVLLQIAKEGQVPIIGFNWKDTRDAAQNWLNVLGDPYTVTAFDPVGDVAIDWGVYGAPETFLIDKDGVIVHKHVGPLTYAIWQSEFLSRISL